MMDVEKAKKAAKWWADHLREGAKLDSGDSSPTGSMTIGMASMLQQTEREGQSSVQIDNFEAVLGKMFEERAEKHFYVSVDYSPDMILMEAAEEAEISLGITTLPWKTTMQIVDGEILAKLGYGGEWIKL